MENTSIKTIALAVSVIIEAVLISILVAMLASVKRTASSQMQALSEIQSEYEARDVSLLDGEVVSAAEAASIARKYRSDSCNIYKDGVAVDRNVLLSRKLFNENSNWRIDLTFSANGNIEKIYFTRPSGVGSNPTTVDEAKTLIANVVGAQVTDSWDSIVAKLNNLANVTEKREQFTTLLSIPSTSDWDVIYSKVTALLTANPTSLSYERFVLTAGGDNSYTMDNPSFCYVYAGSKHGLIIFNGNSCTIKGDFDDTSFAVDIGAKSIHNYSSDVITVYVVKE